MATYTLEKTFPSNVTLSPNVIAVSNMFGLGASRDRPIRVLDNFEIDITPGQVVYITGGSGAGKSLFLRLLKKQMLADQQSVEEEIGQPMPSQMYIDLDELTLPQGTPLVDCFDGSALSEALYWLSMAGLSDAFALLRNPEHLSDGQRYRFRLALALSRRPKVICIDEFCAALDRITAAVVSHNVRKFADRFGTTFIVATSHDDMLEDLAPDVVVVKHLGSGCDVYYPGQGIKQ